jgi:hypothetical protein
VRTIAGALRRGGATFHGRRSLRKIEYFGFRNDVAARAGRFGGETSNFELT